MTIHLWHTDRLADDLALGKVNEHQSLRYAMIGTLLVVVTQYYAYWVGGERSWFLAMEFAAVYVISLIGLRECFKANGAGNGVDFIKRLYCLSVPIGLKLALTSIVIGVAMYFAFPRAITTMGLRDPLLVYEVTVFSIMGALTACLYWRIAFFMGRMAERSDQPQR